MTSVRKQMFLAAAADPSMNDGLDAIMKFLDMVDAIGTDSIEGLCRANMMLYVLHSLTARECEIPPTLETRLDSMLMEQESL